MKKIISTITFILMFNLLHAQITFQKTYGRAGSDAGNDVELTPDGGYIIAGYTGSPGSTLQDACLIKTGYNGDTLWAKSYGGTADEYFRAVAQTGDGGYIATGSTNSFGTPDNKLYLVKTDSAGIMLWSKTYNGPSEETGNAVAQTTDGGYIITGNAGLADLYLIKTDSMGDTLWTRTLNGGVGWSVKQTPDGGFLIGGEILAAGSETIDFYMVKTSGTGDTLWTKIFGGTGTEAGKDMQSTSDGGYIMAGSTTTFGAGGSDAYLIKTDSQGQMLWSKTYGGTGNDVANSVEQTGDGGFIIAGNTNSFGAGLNDIYLVKTDSSGTVQWSKAIGGTVAETGSRVRQANDGGFIITGFTQSFGNGSPQELYLIKTDSAGNSNCNESNAATVTTTPATQTSVFSKVLGYGGAVAVPPTAVTGGVTITTLCTTDGMQPEPGGQSIIVVFPNPSTGSFTIAFETVIDKGECKIYNVFGGKVFEGNIFRSKKESLKNIPTGIYIIKVFDGEKQFIKKLIIEQ